MIKLFLVFSLLISFNSFSQPSDWYFPGHYISNSGEKIEGWMKAKVGFSKQNYDIGIYFKKNKKSKEKVTLDPKEVEKVVVGEHTYVYRPVLSETGFVEIIVSGKVSLYNHMYSINSVSLVFAANGSLGATNNKDFVSKYYLVKSVLPADYFEVPKIGYSKAMFKFFDDEKDFVKSFKRKQTFLYRNTPLLVKRYNELK